MNKVKAAWAKFKAFFTPTRRKLIYRTASAAFGILMVNGLVSAEDATQALAALAWLLGVSVTEMAAGNVNEVE